MKFSDLTFKPHATDPSGKHALVFFENGYGASVVQFRGFGFSALPFGGSYGAEQDKWELAVVQGTEDAWELTYETHITNDVLGHLTEDDVTRVLGEIEALPKNDSAS